MIAVAAADASIALLAGLVAFPLVFSFNLSPSAGAGLAFATLPLVFNQMPGARSWA